MQDPNTHFKGFCFVSCFNHWPFNLIHISTIWAKELIISNYFWCIGAVPECGFINPVDWLLIKKVSTKTQQNLVHVYWKITQIAKIVSDPSTWKQNKNTSWLREKISQDIPKDVPSKRPVTRSFDIFFDLRLNKRLSKHSRRQWFETPSHSL